MRRFLPFFSALSLAFVLMLALGSTSSVAQAARFEYAPSGGSFTEGCEVSVNVELDTQGVDTNAADMFLTYNPSQVEFVDQNPGVPGIQVREGSAYALYAANEVDVGAGTVRVTAFNVIGAFSGESVFVTLVFRSQPGVTSTSFAFDFTPGSSTDSNVADLGGADVLNSVGTSSYSFSPGFCNPDVQAPQVSAFTPANGAQDVSLDTSLGFTITDDQSGVDLAELSVQVHTSTYDQNSPEVTISGDPLNYTVSIDPVVDFPFNTQITTVIQARDVDGNVMSPRVFNFNAPDTQAPVVQDMDPSNGATGVPLDANISFRLTDNKTGVDPASIQVQLDGVTYDQNSPGFTLSGDATNYSISIDPENDFPEETEMSTVVSSSDVGGNTMSQTFRFNRPVPPPPPPVCGNNVVEDGEGCEPSGTAGCDAECQIIVQACFEEVDEGGLLSSDQPIVTQLTSSEFVQDVSDVVFSITDDLGLTDIPEEVEGITVDDIAVESYVCNDTKIEQAEFERIEIPYEAPQGFEIIDDSIRFSCDGALETTVNIPEEYVDVRAVKCVGGQCSTIEVSASQSIQCGQEMVMEESKQDSQVAELEVTALRRRFDPSRYKAESLSGDQIYRFTGFNDQYQAEVHSSLKILSPPVILDRAFDGIPRGEEPVVVELPFVTFEDQVSSGSEALYVYHPELGQWQLVPEGEFLEDGRLQSVFDFKTFAGEDDEVVLAVMGTVCENCEQSFFQKLYSPGESQAAIVLVHGLSGSSSDWTGLVQDMLLTRQPWDVWSYSYPSDRDLGTTAEDLANSLQIRSDEYDVFYVVSHGVGGLVAQEALTFAHRENTINPRRFDFLPKVKKAILIGTPNDAKASDDLLLTFYNYLVNTGRGNLFAVDRVRELLADRPHIPRVPGVDYFVIAGNKAPEESAGMITANLLSLTEPNDGFVTTGSAQKVGGDLLNVQCENYWEVGASHLELLEHPSSRKVIGQIISADLSRRVKDVALLGHQQFFSLVDDQCSPEDQYILIGKKVKREKAPDELGCGCGNGYCGVDEDGVSCPVDCANFFRKENYPVLFWLVVALVVLGGSAAVYQRSRRKKPAGKPKKKGQKSKK